MSAITTTTWPEQVEIWRMKQLLDSVALDGYKRAAQIQYPNLSEEAALLKYVKEVKIEGVFFPNGEGERCIWGEGKSFCLTLQLRSIS